MIGVNFQTFFDELKVIMVGNRKMIMKIVVYYQTAAEVKHVRS